MSKPEFFKKYIRILLILVPTLFGAFLSVKGIREELRIGSGWGGFVFLVIAVMTFIYIQLSLYILNYYYYSNSVSRGTLVPIPTSKQIYIRKFLFIVSGVIVGVFTLFALIGLGIIDIYGS